MKNKNLSRQLQPVAVVTCKGAQRERTRELEKVKTRDVLVVEW